MVQAVFRNEHMLSKILLIGCEQASDLSRVGGKVSTSVHHFCETYSYINMPYPLFSVLTSFPATLDNVHGVKGKYDNSSPLFL